MSVLIKNKQLTVTDPMVAQKIGDITTALDGMGVSTIGFNIAQAVQRLDTLQTAVALKLDGLTMMLNDFRTQDTFQRAFSTTLATAPDAIATSTFSTAVESSIYGSVHSLYGKVGTASDGDVYITVQYSPDGSFWVDSQNIITIPALSTSDFAIDFWASPRFVRLRYELSATTTIQPVLELRLSVRS